MLQSIVLAESVATFGTTLIAGNVSRHTVTAYVNDVRQFLAWAEESTGAATPQDINRRDVIAYLAYLGRELSLTGATRARKLASIRTYFKQLQLEEVIDKSPAADVPEPKRELSPKRWLREREYTSLLRAAASNPRDAALLELMLQTGLRLSEVANLRTGDLDFERKELTVREGKGRQSRVVDFVSKARDAVRNYLNSTTRPDSLDDHVFLNRYGQPLGVRSIQKLVEKYVARAGVEGKDITPHTLRHTWATVHAERGVPLVHIQHQAGHKHLSTTSRYIHEDRQHRAKLMEATAL